MTDKLALTELTRGKILAAIKRRQEAKEAYDKEPTDQNARKLRTARDMLDNGDWVELLMTRVEKLEAEADAQPTVRRAEMDKEFNEMLAEVNRRRNASPWETKNERGSSG